jgi:hypothetical protein
MKKIVIFGTGIGGRAIYRKLKNIHNIVAFIDNNPDLAGIKYDEVDIHLVSDINNLSFDKIAVSGVWIEDMVKQLQEFSVSKEKIWILEDDILNFSTQDRIKTTDNIMKELSTIMEKNSISYCIEGSSLLSLLRGGNLSDVPDVDILIKSQDDLEKLYLELKENNILNQYQIIKIIYQEDKILTKKDTIDKIIVKTNPNSYKEEATVIDINLAIDIGKYYIMDYIDDYYLYFNKEYIDGINYFQYKDMKLLIPCMCENYVTLLYGKNWKIPAKNFSYKDYGNLLTGKDLKILIKEQHI